MSPEREDLKGEMGIGLQSWLWEDRACGGLPVVNTFGQVNDGRWWGGGAQTERVGYKQEGWHGSWREGRQQVLPSFAAVLVIQSRFKLQGCRVMFGKT